MYIYIYIYIYTYIYIYSCIYKICLINLTETHMVLPFSNDFVLQSIPSMTFPSMLL